MRTAAVEVYKFGELVDDVKEKVLERFRNQQAEYFGWDQDYRETIDEFCKLFPVRWKSYGGGRIEYKLTGDDCVLDLSWLRLLRYLVNNYWDKLYKPKFLGWVHRKPVYSKCQRSDDGCPLTGFCGDYGILKPVYEFLSKPTGDSFRELIHDCMVGFAKAVEADYEDSLRDESLIDLIDAKDYEFTKCGRVFSQKC